MLVLADQDLPLAVPDYYLAEDPITNPTHSTNVIDWDPLVSLNLKVFLVIANSL